ncbi:MAG TPA: hypothetical protein VFF10_10395 [Trueperaceae bacterium]|nr:hypothetical protein [Trueperaceae bacterium]
MSGKAHRRLGWRAALVAAVVGLGSLAQAQLLAEVMTTTAIAASFDSAVRFPSGSLRAVGDGVEDLARRLPGSTQWGDWEAYVARGLAANLKPAFVHNVITSFAAAGYFEDSRETRTVEGPAGSETQTKIEFFDMMGSSMHVLYVIETSDEVVWLIGHVR